MASGQDRFRLRHKFVVPAVQAEDDAVLHKYIRNAIIYKNMKRPRKGSRSNSFTAAEAESSNSVSGRRPNNDHSLAQSREIEKNLLELNVKALANQSKQAKAHLQQTQEVADTAQKNLIKVIRERDQEMKNARAASLAESMKEEKAILGLTNQKEDLSAKVKLIEEQLEAMEEKHNQEDAEKEKQYQTEADERKRKAEEQIEEQQRKKQRLDKETEVSETQLLEQELKVCTCLIAFAIYQSIL